MRKRPLLIVLLIQLVLGTTFLVLVATGTLLPGNDDGHKKPAARADLFDGPAAFELVKMQLDLGPRPAGSPASRKLANELRKLLPGGRFQRVPHGLRNVVGTVPGKQPDRYVVVGAHYDSKDQPGFLAANDGAGGTAAVVQLARQLKPRTIGPTVHFVLFDGEEAPRGVPDSQFFAKALRGSKVAAKRFKHAEAMILLDFVADKKLTLPREGTSNEELWAKLRAAARQAGFASYFPPATSVALYDDHTPFQQRGVPSIDLIDWDFPCYHKNCDDLSAVSQRSLDISGESVAELLRTLE
jgi:glutaminyl-peptide cyclotransferase